MGERLYWLGFSVFPGIGPLRFQKLLSRFGSAKAAWSASSADLGTHLGEVLSGKFEKFRSDFSVERYAEELEKKNVSFLTLADREYPALLAKIKNPPFVLYMNGDEETFYSLSDPELARSELVERVEGESRSSPTIAVVGTRNMTQYGAEVTRILTSELVQSEFVIVSGLALGVDAAAHRATIENGGKTIAVLGCGVDCVTPRENEALYNSIVNGNGCVVSELPLGHPPTKGSFPSRNRIIAGLSLGVVVTEGAEDSGALITADYAIKLGRPVFAVPGPITSHLSKGPYKLIEKGARLVTKAEDILRELKLQIPNDPLRSEASKSQINSKSQISKFKTKGDTKEETVILKLLANEPLHFDEIVKRTKMDSSIVGSTLSLMEIKGMVKGGQSGIFSIVQ